ncbi:hypothetical protein Tco_0964773 [Tanacetum coccineum]
MAFVSSNNSGSTNEAVNTAYGVSAVSTQVSAANSTNVDNLSDDAIYGFEMADGHVDYEGKKVLKEHWWSAITATRGDILLESAEFQETKTTGTGKAQEEVCQWRQLLPML